MTRMPCFTPENVSENGGEKICSRLNLSRLQGTRLNPESSWTGTVLELLIRL